MPLTTTKPDTPVTAIYPLVAVQFSCGPNLQTGTQQFDSFYANVNFIKYADNADGTFSASPIQKQPIFIDDVSKITDASQSAFMQSILIAFQTFINSEGI